MQGLGYASFRERKDKMAAVGLRFRKYLRGDVLDVGCDAKYLRTYVQGRYFGMDIAGSPDILVDAERGLPFRAQAFDTVVAFDVLEHLDHLHAAFDELCRVCRTYLVVGLPNMYEWHSRLTFLLGKGIGGKYGLPSDPPADRHRWLFGLGQAKQLVAQRGGNMGFTVVDEVLANYAYRWPLAKLITIVGSRVLPTATSHYWVVLRRDHE